MKKIIFLFLILFMSVLTIKADSTFYLGDKVPNMYIESVNGSDMHNGAPFLLHRKDGALVYCINPFKMMSTTETYKSYTYNNSIFNLTDEQLNKLNIISYYGYGYNNHTDIKWYGVTQYVIYRALGLEDVYFTDVYYGSKVEKYPSEVSELETLVNNYYKVPSFSNMHYEYNPNQSYELIDTNNVLRNYEIKETNIEASINNNKLIINTKGSGNYNITFVRKSPISRNFVLYNLDEAQSLLYPGKINDIIVTLSIEVNSGSITINKYDSENKTRLEATLNGAVFGIYKNDILIDKITIRNNFSGSLNNLALGNYTIKEISTPTGYNKDTNVYNISITKSNKDVVINSYSDVIEGNLIINKYYLDDDEYKLDNNSLFEVYYNKELIKTISNSSKEKLEYGTYLVKQVSGKKYYDLIDDFNTSILEEKDYVYNFYTDKTDEIKAYEEMLNKREESLSKKEEQLIELEKKLEEEKNNLTNLKNEIMKKEEELDNEKQELEKIKEEIELKVNNLTDLEKEIQNQKEDLEKFKEQVNNNSILLQEKEKNLINKESELNKLKEQLELLNNKLKEKEQNLIELENSINCKEKELREKEQELIKLEHKIEQDKNNVLVVEVPNTYKKNYNKLISVILIFIGSMFIIYNKKKVTSHH